MKVKLITATVRIFIVHIKGKPDLRFKTGWRVEPDLYAGYELKIRLENPIGQFRLNEIVITPFGKFMVTSVVGGDFAHVSDMDKIIMDLTQLEAVRRYTEPLVFDAEIDIASGGFMYHGEGSSLPKKLNMVNVPNYEAFTKKYPNI